MVRSPNVTERLLDSDESCVRMQQHASPRTVFQIDKSKLAVKGSTSKQSNRSQWQACQMIFCKATINADAIEVQMYET